MAVVRKKASKKKNIGMVATMLVILTVSGVAIYQNFVAVNKPIERTARSRVVAAKKIDIRKDVLDNEEFAALKSFAELPVQVGKTGKANPFAP